MQEISNVHITMIYNLGLHRERHAMLGRSVPTSGNQSPTARFSDLLVLVTHKYA